jgi:hypothetical protein
MQAAFRAAEFAGRGAARLRQVDRFLDERPLIMRSILSAIETSTPVQIIYQSMTSDD